MGLCPRGLGTWMRLITECTPNTMLVPGLSPCGVPASARCTILACTAARAHQSTRRAPPQAL